MRTGVVVVAAGLVMVVMAVGGCRQAPAEDIYTTMSIPMEAVTVPDGVDFPTWSEQAMKTAVASGVEAMCTTPKRIIVVLHDGSKAATLAAALGAGSNYVMRDINDPVYMAQCKEDFPYSGDEREIAIDPRVKNDSRFWAEFGLRHLSLSLMETQVVHTGGSDPNSVFSAVRVKYSWNYRYRDQDFALMVSALKAKYGDDCCKVVKPQ